MRSKEWWEEKNVFKKESVGMKDRQEERWVTKKKQKYSSSKKFSFGKYFKEHF